MKVSGRQLGDLLDPPDAATCHSAGVRRGVRETIEHHAM